MKIRDLRGAYHKLYLLCIVAGGGEEEFHNFLTAAHAAIKEENGCVTDEETSLLSGDTELGEKSSAILGEMQAVLKKGRESILPWDFWVPKVPCEVVQGILQFLKKNMH